MIQWFSIYMKVRMSCKDGITYDFVSIAGQSTYCSKTAFNLYFMILIIIIHLSHFFLNIIE